MEMKLFRQVIIFSSKFLENNCVISLFLFSTPRLFLIYKFIHLQVARNVPRTTERESWRTCTLPWTTMRTEGCSLHPININLNIPTTLSTNE